jgi:GMP synthase-like glutamine amidotransferase
MPVLVVQHLEPERAAVLGETLEAAGCTLDVVRADLGQPLPRDLAAHDALVVLGGPMSATIDAGFPTRSAELALLRDAVGRGVPTLGVCLGAQLLAAAAGSAVYPGPEPEIGWGEVTLTAEAADDPLFHGIESPLVALHWHGETFDLPEGAVRLAGSSLYPNQAFRLGAAAWGVQFHVEVDQAAVERFATAFAGDTGAIDGGTADILAATGEALAAMAPARTQILSRFAKLAASR